MWTDSIYKPPWRCDADRNIRRCFGMQATTSWKLLSQLLLAPAGLWPAELAVCGTFPHHLLYWMVDLRDETKRCFLFVFVLFFVSFCFFFGGPGGGLGGPGGGFKTDRSNGKATTATGPEKKHPPDHQNRPPDHRKQNKRKTPISVISLAHELAFKGFWKGTAIRKEIGLTKISGHWTENSPQNKSTLSKEASLKPLPNQTKLLFWFLHLTSLQKDPEQFICTLTLK